MEGYANTLTAVQRMLHELTEERFVGTAYAINEHGKRVVPTDSSATKWCAIGYTAKLLGEPDPEWLERALDQLFGYGFSDDVIRLSNTHGFAQTMHAVRLAMKYCGY